MDEGAGRREARRFEPPPWEKEQFNEVETRRAEDVDAREPEARSEPEPSAPGLAGDPAQPGSPSAAEPGGPVAPTVGGEPPAEAPGLDDKAIEAMIFDLRAEEPHAGRPAWLLRVAVSAFLLVLGSVFMLWGMVGLVKVVRTAAETRSAGLLVSGGLLTFGTVFISLAAWAGYTAYQQRGVR